MQDYFSKTVGYILGLIYRYTPDYSFVTHIIFFAIENYLCIISTLIMSNIQAEYLKILKVEIFSTYVRFILTKI